MLCGTELPEAGKDNLDRDTDPPSFALGLAISLTRDVGTGSRC